MIGILNFLWYSAGFIEVAQPGPPRGERGPGASTNITDFRFCELQNRRRKCRSFVRIMMWSPKKKGLYRNFNSISGWNLVISKKMFLGLTCWFLRVISMGSSQAHGPSAGIAEANGLPGAHGPAPWSPWALGSLYPLPPLSVALGIAQPILKHEERRLRCSSSLSLGGRQLDREKYALTQFQNFIFLDTAIKETKLFIHKLVVSVLLPQSKKHLMQKHSTVCSGRK